MILLSIYVEHAQLIANEISKVCKDFDVLFGFSFEHLACQNIPKIYLMHPLQNLEISRSSYNIRPHISVLMAYLGFPLYVVILRNALDTDEGYSFNNVF